MELPQKVIGVEQINSAQIEHTTIDWRPIISLLVWAVLSVSALLVATSCDSQNGMYQGPNDDSPRYGAPK
jgi:hypothetical protein